MGLINWIRAKKQDRKWNEETHRMFLESLESLKKRNNAAGYMEVSGMMSLLMIFDKGKRTLRVEEYEQAMDELRRYGSSETEVLISDNIFKGIGELEEKAKRYFGGILRC